MCVAVVLCVGVLLCVDVLVCWCVGVYMCLGAKEPGSQGKLILYLNENVLACRPIRESHVDQSEY